MNPTSHNSSGDLFRMRGADVLKKNAPLADRMRPRTLDEYVGQNHILGEGRLLRRAIQVDQLSSLIFYGPPGTGKTTLARIIANTTRAHFISINAVLAGVKDIRDAIAQAQELLSLYAKRTILFVDEVHRFNKAQQDALLPHVENGVLILIGATTENPYFEVNKALVSRSRIFQLQSLTTDDLKKVALQAINDPERGYGQKDIIIDDDALDHLVQVANGDARGVLNALELAVETSPPGSNSRIHIDRLVIEDSIQRRAVLYDRDGDAHYDTISAFIKSIRGSDPDAALYWMAKMLYAGEDPRFIFRRMLVSAGEDIGMAAPEALGIVVQAATAFDYVGLPEGRYHLAHACIYLATAPKSNSSMAFFDALATVEREQNDAIPNHLRDANRDKEGFGHGAGYLYPHAYRDHWVAQQYLPDTLQGKIFYQPSNTGYEKGIAASVARMREARIEAMVENDTPSPLTMQGAEDIKNPAHHGWLERSLNNRGSELGRIREIILHMADIHSSDCVLDLYTRTGLLAFEAARHVRDGGVWAMAHSDRSFSTVHQMTEHMELLSRPSVLRTDWNSFETSLREAAGNSVKFDKIIGRGIVTKIPDKIELIRRIAGFLSPAGSIILAEPVPSAGQRLSNCVDLSPARSDLTSILAECENELFSDPYDSMVNWNAATLENDLLQSGTIAGEFIRDTTTETRLIKPTDVEFWFRLNDNNLSVTDCQRKSLGERCHEKAGSTIYEEIKRELHRYLDNKKIAWKTETLFMKLHHAS